MSDVPARNGSGASGTLIDRSVESNGAREATSLGVWPAVVGLAIAAALTRIVGLNSQLWADEVAAVVQRFRLPFKDIAFGTPDVAPHVLYDLAAHVCVRMFGEHPWAVRLPAALFGIAGVVAFCLVARRVGSPLEALLAAGLLTVSYHHVFFSQDARGYTMMIFFALVALLFLVRLSEGSRAASDRVLYLIAVVACAYSVPFGAAVALGHAVVVLAVVLVRRRHGRQGLPSPLNVVIFFAVAGAAIAALYAPAIVGLRRLAETGMGEAAAGSKISFDLIPELVAGLRLGLGGNGLLIVGAIVGLVGTIDYARRDPFVLGLLIVPVAMTAIPLAALGVGVHPRYLLIALPAVLLLGARGLVVLGRVGDRAMRALGVPVTGAAGAIAVVLVVAGSALPLRTYYRVPKQDFRGALALVDREAGPRDRTVAAGNTAHVIHDFYRKDFPTIESLDDLREIEIGAKAKVWVITSIERVLGAHDPALVEHLHRSYMLARVLPATQEDAQMRIYVRDLGD